ncbi:MAG TPA: hypothetical protein DCG57_14275, partial [Candidatus Riflebacteria bacterium]|nr:hypothetical protein [Candidatus Riflebacteria bacterium]
MSIKKRRDQAPFSKNSLQVSGHPCDASSGTVTGEDAGARIGADSDAVSVAGSISVVPEAATGSF